MQSLTDMKDQEMRLADEKPGKKNKRRTFEKEFLRLFLQENLQRREIERHQLNSFNYEQCDVCTLFVDALDVTYSEVMHDQGCFPGVECKCNTRLLLCKKCKY
jgi:hypothetical protein